MSGTLTRLRELFEDELFVRGSWACGRLPALMILLALYPRRSDL